MNETIVWLTKATPGAAKAKTRRIAVALACGAALTVSAQVQAQSPFWKSDNPLTAEDLQIIRQIELQQIHGKAPSTVANWSNPRNGHSGTITLLGKSVRRGLPCEQIQYQLTAPQRRFVFTSCQVADGSWKFAE